MNRFFREKKNVYLSVLLVFVFSAGLLLVFADDYGRPAGQNSVQELEKDKLNQPTTLPNQPVIPIGSLSQPIGPIGSLSQPIDPIGSLSQPIGPIGSLSQPIGPIGSLSQPLIPINPISSISQPIPICPACSTSP